MAEHISWIWLEVWQQAHCQHGNLLESLCNDNLRDRYSKSV